MAKADYSRDYYADLELPASADVNDIKKQFRKLALKYHPDRNPGKEAEVNAKFQTIQAAHEILTSPEQKSKYDNHRSRNAYRYPAASGVRGNPWSDVSSHYPVPPRRPGQAPTSAARNTAPSSGPSGASASSRYSNFNVPPSAKTSKEDLDSRYTAWKNMRPSAAKARPGQSASAAYASANASSGANTSKKTSSSMPPPPPPHPPHQQTPMPARSASQRQKKDASFGTRRPTGFFPQSPMGDEPPAANTNNYFTNRTHTSRSFFFGGEQEPPAEKNPASNEPRRKSTTAAPEPTNGEPRNRSDESFFDSRQSTPYQTHGGEKFNPFDGVPAAADLNRTRSHRTVNPQAAKPEFRRRSSSLPDESDNAAKATASARKRDGGGTGAAAAAAAGGVAAGMAAWAAAEAAGASEEAAAASPSANTSAPRARSRPGASRASRTGASSQMPRFEEQYQRMQGEQQQQSNPFAASNDKSTANNNTPQNGKSKPILYATPSFAQYPYPKQEPYVSQARMAQEAMMSDERARAQRHMACREPAGEATISSSPSIAHTPPKSEWPEPKRRASATKATKESSSGDRNKTFNSVYDSGNKDEKLVAGMNSVEFKQFNILKNLVSKIKVYKPAASDSKSESQSQSRSETKPGHAKLAGQAVSKDGSAAGRAVDRPLSSGSRRRLRSGTVPSCGPFNEQQHASQKYRSHANTVFYPFSSNLSLDDDVFSVPSTPSDQERTNPFTRNSVEDINTRFVSGEKANAAWAFSAGGSEAESNGDFPSRVRRSQSGSRLGRRSPGKSGSIPKPDGNAPPPPPPPQQPPQSQDPSPASSTVGVADGASGKQKGNTTTTTDYFNPGRWAEQIGSEHFVPRTGQQPPNLPPRQPTPTQQKARPIKKPKPIQRTNTAAPTNPAAPREYIVIESDSDDEAGGSAADAEPGTKFRKQEPVEQPDMSGFASPVAMDIDSPPAAEPTFNGAGSAADTARPAGSSGTDTTGGAPLSSPDPQVNGARNIPVEPTRPEWRAGDVNKAATTSAAAAAGASSSAAKPEPSFAGLNAGGSEDTDEFRATLSDIRKVEPFAENKSGIQGNAGAGLGSFGDLQNNLPFESKAASANPTSTTTAAGSASNAARAARSRSRSRRNINFPKPPVAPHPPTALGVPGLHPSAAAWDKYVTEFRHYMLEWQAFNTLYVDHFQARRHDIEMQRRDGEFGWLTSADGDNDGINRYLDWMEQDEEVRARWSDSCSGHDDEVRKFMAYRERMRQS